MVNINTIQLNSAFGALADPTRRAIVSILAKGSATVTEVARPFEISLPAVSKHIRVLEDAGLLRREIKGRIHHLHLNAEPLQIAASWLGLYGEFWEDQLDQLGEFLDRENSTSKL